MITRRTLQLPSGQAIPIFGMGTWQMGEHARHRQGEMAALRHGLELGLSLIDTAEMYESSLRRFSSQQGLAPQCVSTRDDRCL